MHRIILLSSLDNGGAVVGAAVLHCPLRDGLHAAQMSWEKYAPSSESQLGRLSRLKAACGGEEAEAVVRRNQASPGTIQKLGDSAKPAGIATLYKESCGRGAAAVEGGVCDDGGGDDELGESARERGAQLREYARTCQAFVADIERAVHLLDTIAQQQEQVRSKGISCEWAF